MFNRYFVLALISTHKQYLFAPTCLIILSQNVHSQQQIAQDAYGIFQQNCLICQGPDGAYQETLLIGHMRFGLCFCLCKKNNPPRARAFPR